MTFEILSYRDFDNDYIALCSNGKKVIVDTKDIDGFEPKIGNKYCDGNSSAVVYENVYFPKTFDLIKEA